MAVQPLKPQCDVCGEPAAYTAADVDETFCRDCGQYWQGVAHGRADLAQNIVRFGTGEMIAAGLSEEAAVYVAQGEAEGHYRSAGPESTHPDHPRPWTTLLRPVTEEGS